MAKVAMAAAAHPDDIEFMMSGTLMKLKDCGYETHYLNIANGYCGSMTMGYEETIRTRAGEAQSAAEFAGAIFHPSYVDDIAILYDLSLIKKLCALVREAKPEILLLPSPQDYMEDHMNASRVMVTAAFCRNMPNFLSDPQVPAIDTEMSIYHALPYGLMDQLRNPVVASFYVDVGSVMQRKRDMLSKHKSQKDWLDSSQGLDNYVNTLNENCRNMGSMSGKFEFAEGWRQHSHLGFSGEAFDPLTEALSNQITRK